MIFTKIALIGIVLIAMMIVAQEKKLPERAGIVATCTPVRPPAGESVGAWYLCSQGILTGFPNLEGDACDSSGLYAHKELWQCEGPLTDVPGA